MRALRLTALLAVGAAMAWGSAGCSKATTLAVSIRSDVEIVDWQIALALDGAELLRKSLPLDEGSPRTGALGTVVVLLPDRRATADVGVQAHDAAGQILDDRQEVEILPNRRTPLELHLVGADNTYDGPARITVALEGPGSGKVVGGGIDCPGTCTVQQAAPTDLSLSATGALGSAFESWTAGPCQGSSVPTCTFVPSAADTTVVARFIHPDVRVEVVPSASAGATAAAVVSSPSGIQCGTACVATFPYGTDLTLSTLIAPGIGIAWGGACGGSAASCALTLTHDVTVTVDFAAANYAFVSSQTYGSDLGGLAGADSNCQALASTAGLPGATGFRAWISSSTVAARDRFGSARGWMRLDGLPFVDTIADLTAGIVYYPLMLDENGTHRCDPKVAGANSWVMTGTLADGGNITNLSYNANDWTQAGQNVWGGACDLGGFHWTAGYWSSNARLYCLGTSITGQVTAPAVPGSARRAFLSTGTFTPGAQGLAAADELCQTEATDAGIGAASTFRALMATSTSSPASRFNLTGAPWYRLDGVRLAETAADVFDANKQWSAPLNVRADLSHSSDQLVWLGATQPSSTGTAAGTCSDWTAASPPNTVWALKAQWSTMWPSGWTANCGDALALFCLQQ